MANIYLKQLKEARENGNWDRAELLVRQLMNEAEIDPEENDKYQEAGREIADRRNGNNVMAKKL